MKAMKCDSCGKDILVFPCFIKRNKHHFCGVDCKYKWRREHIFGELSPRWKGGPAEVKCGQCGVPLMRSKTEIKEHKVHFCSKECDAKWRSENRRGAVIYNFKGGLLASRERRKNSIRERINARMRAMVRFSLRGKKNGYSWEKLVGYTSGELREHLSKTIPRGMTWDDFMSGNLEIDHIIPQAAFNISSIDDLDFHKCWALKNLRLLPAKENRSKGARIGIPFQPSLAMAVMSCS